MCNYEDCVLLHKNKITGEEKCRGLTRMFCREGIKCNFYGSNKDYYLDKKDFVRRKESKNEKIDF